MDMYGRAAVKYTRGCGNDAFLCVWVCGCADVCTHTCIIQFSSVLHHDEYTHMNAHIHRPTCGCIDVCIHNWIVHVLVGIASRFNALLVYYDVYRRAAVKHTRGRTNVCVCVCACLCVCVCVCVCVHFCVCVWERERVCVFIDVLSVHIISSRSWQECGGYVCVCVCVCVIACVCVCVRVFIHIYMFMYVYIYIHTYICIRIYMCMYVYI